MLAPPLGSSRGRNFLALPRAWCDLFVVPVFETDGTLSTSHLTQCRLGRCSFGTGRGQELRSRTPNAAGSKLRSVESRTTGSNPDTGFSCKHGIGTRPLRPGLTERTRGISYPETALGRKEPRDPLPLGGQCRGSDSPICAVRSCAGAMLLTLDRICANR